MAKYSWDQSLFYVGPCLSCTMYLWVAAKPSFFKSKKNRKKSRKPTPHLCPLRFFCFLAKRNPPDSLVPARYLYSGSPTAMAGLSFGYGIGLPLSRLHAKYLGGSLDLVSLPGYGVDVPWKIFGHCFKRWMDDDGCIKNGWICGTVRFFFSSKTTKNDGELWSSIFKLKENLIRWRLVFLAAESLQGFFRESGKPPSCTAVSDTRPWNLCKNPTLLGGFFANIFFWSAWLIFDCYGLGISPNPVRMDEKSGIHNECLYSPLWTPCRTEAMVLLMVRKSCTSWGIGSLSQYLRRVFRHPNGGWPWDFWTINRSLQVGHNFCSSFR